MHRRVKTGTLRYRYYGYDFSYTVNPTNYRNYRQWRRGRIWTDA